VKDLESLAFLLDQDVTAVVEQRKSVDDCVTEYQSDHEELAELLQIALALTHVPAPPDPMRKAAAREQFIASLRRRNDRTSGTITAFPNPDTSFFEDDLGEAVPAPILAFPLDKVRRVDAQVQVS